MTTAHTTVTVAESRPCDLCRQRPGPPIQAYADAKIPGGGWGYLCREHFRFYGCSLGEGRGQELIVKERP